MYTQNGPGFLDGGFGLRLRVSLANQCGVAADFNVVLLTLT